MACWAVCDGGRTACNCVGDLGIDSQRCLSTSISGRRVPLTARVEVLSRMLVSGGQGREEGHRQGGELHSGYGDRFKG
jgi:hypothetical protein